MAVLTTPVQVTILNLVIQNPQMYLHKRVQTDVYVGVPINMYLPKECLHPHCFVGPLDSISPLVVQSPSTCEWSCWSHSPVPVGWAGSSTCSWMCWFHCQFHPFVRGYANSIHLCPFHPSVPIGLADYCRCRWLHPPVAVGCIHLLPLVVFTCCLHPPVIHLLPLAVVIGCITSTCCHWIHSPSLVAPTCCRLLHLPAVFTCCHCHH
jgi:hypothetical protein